MTDEFPYGIARVAQDPEIQRVRESARESIVRLRARLAESRRRIEALELELRLSQQQTHDVRLQAEARVQGIFEAVRTLDLLRQNVTITVREGSTESSSGNT